MATGSSRVSIFLFLTVRKVGSNPLIVSTQKVELHMRCVKSMFFLTIYIYSILKG